MTSLLTWLLLIVWHVAPNGHPDGEGSFEKPWDLATALAGPASVRPGDEVVLRAGTYRGGFESKLQGTPEAPIVVRGERGKRTTIDLNPRDDRDPATLYIFGADVVFRDLEITNTHPKRATLIKGSWPDDIRRGGVDVRGDRAAMVNLVVHDLGSGFGLWSKAEGGTISGCLIYYNGHNAPDRGHGHGIYVQNERGVKRLVDNVVFDQFGYGIHAYGSSKASLKNIEIVGNVCFDNGRLAGPTNQTPGVFVGGECPVVGAVVKENVSSGGGMRFGYPWGPVNEDLVVSDNFVEGAFSIRDFKRGQVERNVITGESSVAILDAKEGLLTKGLAWNKNRYFMTDGRWGEFALIAEGKSRGATFAEWKAATGFDADSSFTKGRPEETRVVVRPNAHEPGRALVVVINPKESPKVEVDLANVLQVGQKYRVVNARDFHGPPVARGTFEGKKVVVPIRAIDVPKPVGMPDFEVPSPEPKLGTYVVLPE